MTGDDDPDDRRTYPWADLGGSPDTALLAHYTALAALRDDVAGADRRRLPGPARRTTPTRPSRTAARPASQAAIVAAQPLRRPSARSTIPVGGYLPGRDVARAAVRRRRRRRRARSTVADGVDRDHAAADVGARAGDRPGRPEPPAAPANLHVTNEAANELVGRLERRAPAPPATTSTSARCRAAATSARTTRRSPARRSRSTGCRTRSTAYVVVRALDAAGNASAAVERGRRRCRTSIIGWANLQWPPSLTHTISTVDRTDNVYGQVWIDGVTNQPGATPGLVAQLGFGPDGSDPDRQRGVDVGRRGVQRRRRQQRRVRRVAPARGARHVRLRLPLHGHERPRLGLRRPRRDRQRLPARPGRLADGQPERATRRRPPRPTGLHGRLGLAGRHRARVGRGRRRPDAVRLRGPPRRRVRRPVRDDRLDVVDVATPTRT